MTTEYYPTIDDYPQTTDELCVVAPDPQEILVQTYIHSFICAFGLIGNILVIVTYIFYKRTKTMTDVYLFNVAVIDLIFVVALPFIIYNEQNNWWMGTAACKILRSTYSMNLYCGMLLLACISGDRYIAIVQARRSFGSRSQSLLYSRIICAVVWIFALSLTLPTIIYTQTFKEMNFGLPVSVSCEMSFDEDETARLVKILVPSLQMAIGFLLPFLIMTFCYSCILITLLRAQSSQRHKAIRVVFAVVVVFILCHFPYNVVLLKHTLSLFKERSCKMEKIKFKILAISQSIAYLHCCLNPILYAFVGVKFRSHFRQIMVDLWCISKKYIYNARSSRNTSDTGMTGFSTGFKSDSSQMSSFSA
ncbi:hypothetical protein NQD34_016166 [Periophthalmus magnuspinnatus]|uniref:C-C chemokine receptor type 6 n=1 Tax=Periophthalmus magnuspinnatus TaxID=409849 RepID=UPI00145B69C2|nr:C-C chemokine receptor type 6 [Periophthalmus magnuspinnatus]KAJ0008751.1 hypothetical protein NQD34_016166 [Periophthalmus magnuspinnatus]